MFNYMFSMMHDKSYAEYDPYYKDVSVLMHGNILNDLSTVYDSGSKNPVLTLAGSATLVPQPVKYGNASVSLNGTTAYVDIAISSNIQVGNGTFTIEGWFYPTSLANTPNIFFYGNGSTLNDSINMYINTNGTINFAIYQGATNYSISTGVVVVINTWQHMAFTRSGNTIYAFINGVLAGSSAAAGTVGVPSTSPIAAIGKRYSAGSSTAFFTGFVHDFRFTKGICRYTTAFTPPNTEFYDYNDTYISKVTALLHGDGTNGSTFFPENSGYQTMLVQQESTGSTISTAVSKYSGSSINIVNNSAITLSNTNGNIFTADYTVEGWFYPTALVNDTGLFSKSTDMALSIDADGSISIWSTATKVYTSSPSIITINAWNHVALSRIESNNYVFVNGNLITTYVRSGNIWDVVAPVRLGQYTTNPTFLGYVEEFRITNGAGRYTSNFILETFAYPNPSLKDPLIDNVSLLITGSGLNNSTNIIDSSAYTNTISAISGAKISTAKTKIVGSSILLNGTTDYIQAIASPDFNFGTDDFGIDMWVNCTAITGTGAHPLITLRSAGSMLLLGTSSGGGEGRLIATTNTNSVTSSVVLTANTWYHIYVGRYNAAQGGSIYIAIDGAYVGGTIETGVIGDSVTNLQIGYDAITSTYWNGNIENIRITKGNARYPEMWPVGTFTPPYRGAMIPQVLKDRYFSNVSLLLKGDGSIAVDSSSNAAVVTSASGAIISTTVAKFGVSSIYFPNASSYISIPRNSSNEISTGDFTIEAWVYLNGNCEFVLFSYANDNTQSVIPIINYRIAINSLRPLLNSVNVNFQSPTVLATYSVWQHHALVRAGSNFTMYLNGISIGTNTNSAALCSVSTSFPIIMGKLLSSGGATGYMDDFRLTKGLARYTANFTPPARTFPTV